MSNYELQIRQTGQIYDEAIRAAERESIEVLSISLLLVRICNPCVCWGLKKVPKK